MNIYFKAITLSFLSISAFSMDSNTASKLGAPFLRVINGEEQGELQYASKTYRQPSSNLKVTLLSGMHFAKSEFYKRHTEILDRTDLVLYEGKGWDKKGFLWENQPEIKKHKKLEFYVVSAQAYGLAYQFDALDYQKTHFVLADYTFEEECPNPTNTLKEIKEFIAERSKKYEKEAIEHGYEDGFDYFVKLQIERRKAQPLSELASIFARACQNTEEFIKKEASPAELQENIPSVIRLFWINSLNKPNK